MRVVVIRGTVSTTFESVTSFEIMDNELKIKIEEGELKHTLKINTKNCLVCVEEL